LTSPHSPPRFSIATPSTLVQAWPLQRRAGVSAPIWGKRQHSHDFSAVSPLLAVQLLPKPKSGVLVVTLLVECVRRLAMNAGGHRYPPGALCRCPSFHVSHQCRSDARFTSILQDHKSSEPGNRLVIVRRRNQVGCHQTNDFTETISRDECGGSRKTGKRREPRRNLRLSGWISELLQQLAQRGRIGRSRRSDCYYVRQRMLLRMCAQLASGVTLRIRLLGLQSKSTATQH
jgi:hypothetical protein